MILAIINYFDLKKQKLINKNMENTNTTINNFINPADSCEDSLSLLRNICIKYKVPDEKCNKFIRMSPKFEHFMYCKSLNKLYLSYEDYQRYYASLTCNFNMLQKYKYDEK